MKQILSLYQIVTFSTLFCVLLSSCDSSKQVIYLQDIQPNEEHPISKPSDITLEPKDEISILVNCKDPEVSAMFNLTKAQYTAGLGTSLTSAGMGQLSGYTVDSNGNINFPILGKLKVGGLTRHQISLMIQELLIKKKLVQNPIVTVEFSNLYFSALGEFARPGKYFITKDRMTLLEGISMAGDLTIYGKRNPVLVIREENGKRVTYKVDLLSKSLFQSPAFYLKQNDIIYVEPNKVRAGQSTINENSLKSIGLWISVGSFLSSLGVLIFRR